MSGGRWLALGVQLQQQGFGVGVQAHRCDAHQRVGLQRPFARAQIAQALDRLQRRGMHARIAFAGLGQRRGGSRQAGRQGLVDGQAVVMLAAQGGQLLPQRRLPGLGDVNWSKFFSVLTEVYSGPICIEVEDRAYEGSLANRQASLIQSGRYLRQFLP